MSGNIAISKVFLSAVTCAAMFSSVNAWANNLTQSPEIFLPNSAPRGEFVLHEGDVLAQFPIFWSSAARIARSVTVNIAGKTENLAAGTLLPETLITLPFQQAGERGKTAFCTARKHGERQMEHGAMRLLFGNGLLARQIAEHQSSGQFCFFDPRNSGFLDEVRYYDSSFKEGTPPEKVDLLAYTPLTMVPVSASEQDEVRLTVTHIGRHSMEIGLKIIQVGLARVFTTITSEGFTAGRTYKIGLDMPLPQAEDYFGVDFEVVAVDHDAKSVKIRFPENFDKNRVLVIPEETKIHYCFGYACPKN